MIKTTQRTLLLPKDFGLKSSNLLKYFLIFTAWPVLSIFVSVTLYLFAFLLKEIKSNKGTYFLKSDHQSYKFYVFAVVSLLSLMLSPWDKLHGSLLEDLQLQIQYFYWMMVSVFFIHIYRYCNKDELNKFIFIGLCLHTIQFYFFNAQLPIPLIRTLVTRNGFVYTILALWPLAAGHVYGRYGRNAGNFSLLLILLVMLLSDGRAGTIIIMIENLFIYFIFNRANAQLIRILLIILIPFASIVGPKIVNDENRQALGEVASKLSPRVGDFIKGEGSSGDLAIDKSWLTRKLMVSKGFEIINDYPFFGIGIGHFSEYQAELKQLRTEEYRQLGGSVFFDEAYYNHKSAHNSYVHLASEMGLTGFIVLLLILIPPLIFSIKKLVLLSITKDDLILISLIGICIHFYSITSLPGTVTWFVLGLVYSRMYAGSKTKIRKVFLRKQEAVPEILPQRS